MESPDMGPQGPTGPQFRLNASKPQLRLINPNSGLWVYGWMEIHPCILQFFSTLELLPCFNSAAVTNYIKQGKGIADHMKSLDYWFSLYSLKGYKLKKMGG